MQRTLSGVTVGIAAGSMMIVFTLLLLSKNLNSLLSYWGESVQVSVYLSDDIYPEERASLEKFISETSVIKKYDHVSPQQALEEMKAQLASVSNSLVDDESLKEYLPESYLLTLDQSKIADGVDQAVTALVSQLQELRGVSDVTYGRDLATRFQSVASGFKVSFGFIGASLIFACIFMVTNSIRAQFESRRKEIEVMEFIGATAWFIRKKFIGRGLFTGFFAGGVGIVLSGALYLIAKRYLVVTLGLQSLEDVLRFFDGGQIFGLLILAATIGGLGALLALYKMNTGWAGSPPVS